MLASSQPFTIHRSRAAAGGRSRARRLARWTVIASLATVGTLVAACAGAPVQEMSDTRQTIRAAEHAGAERVAPAPLAEAREGLRRAEDSLKQRDYRAARREAETAHAKAVEALKVASSANAPTPR
jgi:hypothetical protein